MNRINLVRITVQRNNIRNEINRITPTWHSSNALMLIRPARLPVSSRHDHSWCDNLLESMNLCNGRWPINEDISNDFPYLAFSIDFPIPFSPDMYQRHFKKFHFIRTFNVVINRRHAIKTLQHFLFHSEFSLSSSSTHISITIKIIGHTIVEIEAFSTWSLILLL